MRALTLLLCVGLLVGGCGDKGSSKSSAPLSANAFKLKFEAAQATLEALGADVVAAIRTAPQKTDDQIRTEFGRFTTRAEAISQRLDRLKAPAKYAKEFDAVRSALNGVRAGLNNVAAAAAKHDAASAQKATQDFIVRAAALGRAINALTEKLKT